jgi:hypothetical protein
VIKEFLFPCSVQIWEIVREQGTNCLDCVGYLSCLLSYLKYLGGLNCGLSFRYYCYFNSYWPIEEKKEYNALLLELRLPMI